MRYKLYNGTTQEAMSVLVSDSITGSSSVLVKGPVSSFKMYMYKLLLIYRSGTYGLVSDF